MPDVKLIYEVRNLLGLSTQSELARFLGCSVRTVQRNAHNGGLSFAGDHPKLIHAAHARSPEIAERLARSYGLTLEQLGLPAVRRPVAARSEHVDSVVAAAADALDMSPKSVRAAVAAAFTRAQELNVALDTLVPLLAPRKGKTAQPAA